jgi:molecular chaperone HscB
MSGAPKPESLFRVLNGRADTAACWSCGDMRAAHFCEACGKLQPAGPTDYFSFFGLPRKLNIDPPALEQEFYRLSRKLHPDLYVGATDLERDWSLEKSSQLNAAYRTLRDPIARTEYLLRLEGVHFDEQSKSATERARQTGEQKKQIVPPALLEEVFELNMQLEEFRADRSDPQLRRELEQACQRLEDKYQALAAELQGYWDEWDALVRDESCGEEVSPEERRAALAKMLDLLNRRTYIRNLVRDVSEALEN